MAAEKHILLFGAGKSATVLIDHLKNVVIDRGWRLTVADQDLATVRAKTGEHPLITAQQVAVDDEAARKDLVQTADVVISLLPPSLHYLVAQECIQFSKHLLTASYVDERLADMAKEINKLDVLFLCEMGLDPGIDHMSAMQLIHRIQDQGGTINSFVSHCGGLVAPESDDNPWHYKISWNPRNIVLAGKAGAIFKDHNTNITLGYEQLFDGCHQVQVNGVGPLAYYPNRDSLSYVKIYGLEKTATFIRTTLRHPDFCEAWKTVVELGLTDEKNTIETDSMSVAAFLKAHFDRKKISPKLDNGKLLAQFEFLGLNDETLINKGQACSADILQWIIEKKWALQETDKDMIVMLHEFEYTLDGVDRTLKSELVVKGEDNLRTAMAKTVGLPLGIAAVALLDGKIAERGLHIPTLPGIYEPVLSELANHGIAFVETSDQV